MQGRGVVAVVLKTVAWPSFRALGFRVKGLRALGRFGLGLWGLRFRVSGLGFMAQGVEDK